MLITLKLSREKVNVILRGLGELPAKLVMPLIDEITKVSSSQIKDELDGQKKEKIKSERKN